ncbi:hypothetical protein G8764_19585 [Pseudomaricurvus alcaniphilus]|uniref:hypothetical protein n=1 Tax=Pseudomaricurvus alcaniphilus TaxID=1166482 RepID=UPI001407B36B|nr:hypothetical protein [Pseudomaricurvus alcaniphilus]NHN39508.1 hypothetical protein [Pseudomaricurvus alcaniphilus]
MKDMSGESNGDNCPFEFNFDEKTFKPGDIVSYRVPESFGDMPFVGILVSVADDHVMLAHYDPNVPIDKIEKTMRGTRESRPAVSAKDALGE